MKRLLITLFLLFFFTLIAGCNVNIGSSSPGMPGAWVTLDSEDDFISLINDFSEYDIKYYKRENDNVRFLLINEKNREDILKLISEKEYVLKVMDEYRNIY